MHVTEHKPSHLARVFSSQVVRLQEDTGSRYVRETSACNSVNLCANVFLFLLLLQRNMEVYQENAPVGVPNVAGVLSIPRKIEAFKGFPNIILVQHVSGNQGVIVKTIELSGDSPNDFVLTFTGNTPLLIRKGSSLGVKIEYIGNEKVAQAQIELKLSGKDSIGGNIVGRLKEDNLVSTTNQPSFLRSRTPSEALLQQPSNKPSGVPSLRPTDYTPYSEGSSPPPTNQPSLRQSQSLTAPTTTNEPPTEFTDLIINAGASDEDVTKVSTAMTWTYKVFPFVQISNTDVPSFIGPTALPLA